MLPTHIHRYEIKSELGRGGMATVYLGYDPRFRREVAIKVLPREFLHDPQFRARFEREAQTIAMLDHPAIVPVYDFGEDADAGLPYLVMRLMTGGSLAARLKPGPLSLAEAARILNRLAPALDEAHTHGVVHRDLKPGNILFDQRDDPYLSDFGIVKLTESSAAFTGSGLIGTPAYMSPEQVRGEARIDGRSDIYALGVILFEMLAGKQPFEATTPIGVAFKHVTDPVPRILDLKPELPLDAQAVIERAMAKAPEGRFPAASTMASALAAIVSGAVTLPKIVAVEVTPTATTENIRETVAAPPEAEPREPVAAPAAPPEPVAAPVLASAHEAETAPPTERPTVPASALPTVEASPAKRDQRRLWLAFGMVSLVIVAGIIAIALFGNGPAQTRGTSTAAGFASASARALAAIEQSTATPIPHPPTSTGGSETRPSATPTPTAIPPTATFTPTPVPPTPTVSPTPTDSVPVGKHVMRVFSDNKTGSNDIFVECSDGSVINVTNSPGNDRTPALSPDGTRIVFVSRRTGNDEIFVMKTDGSELSNLTNTQAQEAHPVWSADGKRIAFLSDRDGHLEVYAMTADGSQQTRLTNTPAGAEGNMRDSNVGPSYVWSPNGGRMAFLAADNLGSEVYVVNADGSGQLRLPASPGNYLIPVWSPDSRRITYSWGHSGDYEVLVVGADGSGQFSLGFTRSYAWSPDGSRIAFSPSSGEGYNTNELFVVTADGSDRINLAQNAGGANWSYDSTRLAFSSSDGSLYMVKANGSGLASLASHAALVRGPLWSLDSTRLVFVSDQDGNNEIYVVNIDGSGLTNLTNNPATDDDPVWLPDGRIRFQSARDGKLRYYVMNPDGSNVQAY